MIEHKNLLETWLKNMFPNFYTQLARDFLLFCTQLWNTNIITLNSFIGSNKFGNNTHPAFNPDFAYDSLKHIKCLPNIYQTKM